VPHRMPSSRSVSTGPGSLLHGGQTSSCRRMPGWMMLMGGNIVNVLLPPASSRTRWVVGKVGMLLGPEGTGPAPLWGRVLLSLCRVRIPVLIPVPDRGLAPGFLGGWVVGGAGGLWWGFVGWWVFVNWIVDASIL
jgi:hypothetical protein